MEMETINATSVGNVTSAMTTGTNGARGYEREDERGERHEEEGEYRERSDDRD